MSNIVPVDDQALAVQTNDIHMQVTNRGRKLNAKINAGKGTIPLHLTRVVSASRRADDPIDADDPSNSDANIGIQQTGTIQSQKYFGERAEITVLFTNWGNPATGEPPLTAGYPLAQFRLYAHDPDAGEILYRVSQFDPVRFVPTPKQVGWTHNPTWNFTTANASEVIVSINPAGVATLDYVWNNIEGHDQDPAAHKTILAQLAAIIGHVISGIVNTFTALPPTANLPPGIVFLVRVDETQNGAATLYKVGELGEWVFVAKLGGAGGQAANTLITTMPISPSDHFASWELRANDGGIFAPLEEWGFTNAVLTEVDSRVSVDLNTSHLSIFATAQYAGQSWSVTEYQPGVWLITAVGNPHMSLILIRKR